MLYEKTSASYRGLTAVSMLNLPLYRSRDQVAG
jgi:hypothetical protein